MHTARTHPRGLDPGKPLKLRGQPGRGGNSPLRHRVELGELGDGHRAQHFAHPVVESQEIVVGVRIAVAPGFVDEQVHPKKPGATAMRTRSEEHTSELQSLTNLVCRLLLAKKKKT